MDFIYSAAGEKRFQEEIDLFFFYYSFGKLTDWRYVC